MANQSTIAIEIKVDDKGSVTIKQFGTDAAKSLGDVEKSAATTSGAMAGLKQSWTDLAVQGTAAWMAVTKAMTYMEEGAKARQVESSFKIMAEAAGANADLMIDHMKRATQETIDDSDLMQKAIKLMTLGYDPSQIERFSEVVHTAATIAGTTDTEAYERLADAIANRMPKALVQMGAATKDQMKIVNEAMAAGVDQAALMEFAIANLALKQTMLKGTTDEASISLQKFHAITSETKETIGKGLIIVADALYRSFQFLAAQVLDVVAAYYQFKTAAYELIGADKKAAESRADWNAALSASNDLMGKAGKAIFDNSAATAKSSAEEKAAAAAAVSFQTARLKFIADEGMSEADRTAARKKAADELLAKAKKEAEYYKGLEEESLKQYFKGIDDKEEADIKFGQDEAKRKKEEFAYYDKLEEESLKSWFKFIDDKEEADIKAGQDAASETIATLKERAEAEREILKDLRGYQDEYYSAVDQLSLNQYDKYIALGVKKEIADAWLTGQMQAQLIKRGKDSDDFMAGVNAGLIEMQNNAMTFGKAGYEIFNTFATESTKVVEGFFEGILGGYADQEDAIKTAAEKEQAAVLKAKEDTVAGILKAEQGKFDEIDKMEEQAKKDLQSNLDEQQKVYDNAVKDILKTEKDKYTEIDKALEEKVKLENDALDELAKIYKTSKDDILKLEKEKYDEIDKMRDNEVESLKTAEEKKVDAINDSLKVALDAVKSQEKEKTIAYDDAISLLEDAEKKKFSDLDAMVKAGSLTFLDAENQKSEIATDTRKLIEAQEAEKNVVLTKLYNAAALSFTGTEAAKAKQDAVTNGMILKAEQLKDQALTQYQDDAKREFDKAENAKVAQDAITQGKIQTAAETLQTNTQLLWDQAKIDYAAAQADKLTASIKSKDDILAAEKTKNGNLNTLYSENKTAYEQSEADRKTATDTALKGIEDANTLADKEAKKITDNMNANIDKVGINWGTLWDGMEKKLIETAAKMVIDAAANTIGMLFQAAWTKDSSSILGIINKGWDLWNSVSGGGTSPETGSINMGGSDTTGWMADAGGYGGHAQGGPVMPGNPVWVGEKGAELLFPTATGYVMEHGKSIAYAAQNGGFIPGYAAGGLVAPPGTTSLASPLELISKGAYENDSGITIVGGYRLWDGPEGKYWDQQEAQTGVLSPKYAWQAIQIGDNLKRLFFADGTFADSPIDDTTIPFMGKLITGLSLALISYITGGAASYVGGGLYGAAIGAGAGATTGLAASGGNWNAAAIGAVLGGVGGYNATAAQTTSLLDAAETIGTSMAKKFAIDQALQYIGNAINGGSGGSASFSFEGADGDLSWLYDDMKKIAPQSDSFAFPMVSAASGLDYVPRDNFRINAHEGEAVLNRKDAQDWRGGGRNNTPIHVHLELDGKEVGLAIIAHDEVTEKIYVRSQKLAKWGH